MSWKLRRAHYYQSQRGGGGGAPAPQFETVNSRNKLGSSFLVAMAHKLCISEMSQRYIKLSLDTRLIAK